MKASEHQLVGVLERPMKTSDSRINEIREHHFKLYTEEVLPLAAKELAARPESECSADSLKAIAENIAVDNLIVPPEWTGFATCSNCGAVPFLSTCKGEFVVSCPWCHSAGMKRTSAALKRISVCPDLELRELKELAK
jgi:hypothetical protein